MTLRRAGALGVAVISAILESENIDIAVHCLLEDSCHADRVIKRGNYERSCNGECFAYS